MTEYELKEIKKIVSNYCHNGDGYKSFFDLYNYNGRNLHLFSNYRVVGESKYYCLAKDNTIFEKYNAYRTRFDYGGRGRRFKFEDKFGNIVYIKPTELNNYFFSDIDLYLEDILDIFHCKSDYERKMFVRRKKLDNCLTD